MFGNRTELFGITDVEESILLTDIKHGHRYLSCQYFPEGDSRYPGYIKVDVMNRETVEHMESRHPQYREHYSRYAKRELFSLHNSHDHRREYRFSWMRDPYSVLY